MEPRCEHRGEHALSRRRRTDVPASMEPRCEHRGEYRWAELQARAGRASMEPRCEHRGESRSCAGASRCRWLQWSRGANTAESSAVARRRRSWSLLQWSRGANTAESGGAPGCEPSAGGFNGAAVRTPRRDVGPGWVGWTNTGFNGAAVRTPRRDRCRVLRLQVDVASMEPRCEHRGERRLCVRRASRVCFNGAAVRTPRRAQRERMVLLEVFGLQWSRGANTAESQAVVGASG